MRSAAVVASEGSTPCEGAMPPANATPSNPLGASCCPEVMQVASFTRCRRRTHTYKKKKVASSIKLAVKTSPSERAAEGSPSRQLTESAWQTVRCVKLHVELVRQKKKKARNGVENHQQQQKRTGSQGYHGSDARNDGQRLQTSAKIPAKVFQRCY